jgi:hypothetical protein
MGGRFIQRRYVLQNTESRNGDIRIPRYVKLLFFFCVCGGVEASRKGYSAEISNFIKVSVSTLRQRNLCGLCFRSTNLFVGNLQ